MSSPKFHSGDYPTVKRNRNRQRVLLYSSRQRNDSHPPPLPDSDDPYVLLGLQNASVEILSDGKAIKRAYKRMAMLYHPDMILDKNSSDEERKRAGDNFARINAAYEALGRGGKNNGKDTKNNSAYSQSNTNNKASSNASNWNDPPHRRKAAYSNSKSSYTGKSSSWEDYMPNQAEEDAKYDANGDSFGSIFSDLVSGVVGGAASTGVGVGGVVQDLIEFLEGNIEGFSSNAYYNNENDQNDSYLRYLLTLADTKEVAEEMDDALLLSQQLKKKLDLFDNDIITLQAELNENVASSTNMDMSSSSSNKGKFVRNIQLREQIEEIKARQKVVKGYLKTANNRAVKLQERYKELVTKGRYDRQQQQADTTSRQNTDYSAQSSTTSDGPNMQDRTATQSGGYSSSSSSGETYSTQSTNRSRKREGFRSRRGSTGRSRSSRSSSEFGNGSNTPNRNDRSAYSPSSTSSSTYSNNLNSSIKRNAIPEDESYYVPPHRRTYSSADQASKDKRRLREIKVEEEIDQLKKDLGLS